LHLSVYELETLIDLIDRDLQAADDVEQQIMSDQMLSGFEEMLHLVADEKSRAERLRAVKRKVEEERDQRRGEAHTA
jgi:hypothetical protein